MIRLQDQHILQKIDYRDPATWIATWFGCGFFQPGPGTWGTLGALPFGIFLLFFGGPIALVCGLVLIIPLGFWASERFEKMTKQKDPGMIVIDEAAGLWITMLAATPTTLSILLAFFLFRAFDIIKPWPISWMDKKLKGATSVMADDMMAGLYAALVLIGLRYVGFG